MRFAPLLRVVVVLTLVMLTGRSHALVLKIATLSPDGSSWMKEMRKGAMEVAQKTDSRVRFKFYPGGIMGDDKTVLRKIRFGQLHGGAVVSNSLTHSFSDNQIYNLPMIFQSFEEVDYVRERMDGLIIEGFKKNGFITFGLAEGGFAYMMSNSPLQTLVDLRKQKVWIPENDSTALETVRAFGVTPIPLSIADVRTGLQTGLIDTVTTSPIGAIALQWHTQVKYLMDNPLMYIYAVLALDRKAFNNISPDDQNIVTRVMGAVFRKIDQQNREDNVKALEVLRRQNIQFVKLTAESREEWTAKASLVAGRLIEAGALSREIVSTLEKYLNEYRSKRPNTN
ncbi:TRAP transporter substrate-binding protein DctP [Thermodesulfobacteriota bacterium]